MKKLEKYYNLKKKIEYLLSKNQKLIIAGILSAAIVAAQGW